MIIKMSKIAIRIPIAERKSPGHFALSARERKGIMKTKRLIALASAICALCLIFSGCGSGGTASPETTQAATQAETVKPKTTVDASWFDDAVFVGDSVTLALSYYCADNPDALGKAQFFCAGSLGYGSALWALDDPEAVHPYYRGEVHLTEDCALVTGADKVFVMLGINDLGLYGIDDTLKNFKTLLLNINSKSPGAKIYVQSVTPMIDGKEYESLTNEMIREFNSKLKAACDASDIPYLDIYSVVADEEGFLRDDYCGDPDAMGIHFTDAACELWTKYLKENVQ